jgi:hypothetical protein
MLKAALKWHRLRFPFVAGLTRSPEKSSIKREVKKKHLSNDWNFCYFPAPMNEQDLL